MSGKTTKTTQSSEIDHERRGVNRVALTAIIISIASTCACAIFAALGHGDLTIARILGLSGMGWGIVTEGCAIVIRTPGKKALYATVGLLLLIAASTVYGISWSR